MTDCISYFDESGDEATFVVGGLTSTAARWDTLAHDWASALAAPPAIPYFKFNNFKDYGYSNECSVQSQLHIMMMKMLV